CGTREGGLMPTDLMGAYNDVYGKFQAVHQAVQKGDAADYGVLVDTMHANVIVKRVRVPVSLIGKADVLRYLNEQMLGRNCHFEEVVTSAWVNKAELYGTVSGQGKYYDDDNEVNPTPVFFAWCYTRATVKDDWVLINVFGAPIGAPAGAAQAA